MYNFLKFFTETVNFLILQFCEIVESQIQKKTFHYATYNIVFVTTFHISEKWKKDMAILWKNVIFFRKERHGHF